MTSHMGQLLSRYAHDLYDVWMSDPERDMGDHIVGRIVGDLLHALSFEEYDEAATLLACIDGFQTADLNDS